MKKKLLIIIPIAVVLSLIIGVFIYLEIYYHADNDAKEALKSNKNVVVAKNDYGYFFDGISEDDALIFYPGAKVEAEAYAPLCMALAENGMDVFLVEMPFRMAFLGKNKANKIMANYTYENWYIGGHSLGGAMASSYAIDNASKLKGLILFAAYSTEKLDDKLKVISIYGSNDEVLNKEKYESYKVNLPTDTYEYVIEGGNHAQFGSYGNQSGDGIATISKEEQISKTVDFIIKNI